MKRWWANPSDAINALVVVDDSDVVNGVGVALLGYHGLSQAALQPLAKETLVDVASVCKALSEVDLSPVAKALGNATKPVMGDASERYGQLLAEDIHKRAVAATERLLNTWTNNGMSWPQAIEKAAEVHGVPLERLGRYAHVMKATNITPHVRADYADRELMAYAADFGKRESIVDASLVEKQEKKREFKEEDHPRNPDGEFRAKDASVSQITDKLSRMNRINRINRIGGLNRKLSDKKKESTVEQKTVEQKTVEQKTFAEKKFAEKKFAEKKYGRKVYAAKNFSNDAPSGPKETDYKKVDNPFRWDKTVFIPLNTQTFDNIRFQLNGNFFIGQLDKNGVEAISEDEMEDWVNAYGGNRGLRAGLDAMRNDNVFLMRSTDTPVDPDTLEGKTGKQKPVRENLHNDTASAYIVPRAKFSIVPSGGEMLRIGGNNDLLYPTSFITLENVDFEDFSKNLNGKDLQNFNEEHPRAEDGTFTNKNKVVDIKQARVDRINRMNRVGAQNRAQQMKRLLEQQQSLQNKKDALANQFEQKKFAEKKFAEKKFADKKFQPKDFRKVDWSKVNDNLKPLPEPLDLSNKLAMFIGMDSTKKADDIDYWVSKIPDDIGANYNPEDVDAPRPFNNEKLFNDNIPSFLKVSALEKIVEDADRFNQNHQGRTDKKYVRNQYNGKKMFFDYKDIDEGIAALFADKPNNLVEGDKVWQPVVEDYKDRLGQLTDEVVVAWEAQPISDDVQILLGTAEEFQELKNGNAMIEPVNGVNCLFDLLFNSTEGKPYDSEHIFDELFNLGLRSDVGTNPPVSAYTIKIGQNS